jgi:hypothetical protein
MARHAKIEGADDLCIPKEKVRAVLAFGTKFDGAPMGYSDSDEFAQLLPPNAGASETSSVSAADRNAIAAKVRSKVYWTQLGGCSFNYLEALGKATGSCDLSGDRLYVGAAPTVARTQKCESVPVFACTDECDEHDDCNGLLCGCSESRCTIFGTCTACPPLSGCDDPEFNLKTTPWKVSVAPKTDEGKAEAKKLDRSTMVLGFTVRNAWRKVTIGTKKDYEDKPEKFVEHDSGYYLDVNPLVLSSVECRGSCSGSAKVGIDAHQGGPLKLTVESGGRTIEVSCPKDECTAKAK